MRNNDVLRKVRYAFDLRDSQMMKIFEMGKCPLDIDLVCNYLRQDDHPDFVECSNEHLEAFLDGFIVFKRGPKNG